MGAREVERVGSKRKGETDRKGKTDRMIGRDSNDPADQSHSQHEFLTAGDNPQEMRIKCRKLETELILASQDRAIADLECPICCEPFDAAGLQVPKMLPCAHTVCHACLCRLRRKECPICKSALSGSSPSFPNNFLVCDIIAGRRAASLRQAVVSIPAQLARTKAQIENAIGDAESKFTAAMTHTNEVWRSQYLQQHVVQDVFAVHHRRFLGAAQKASEVLDRALCTSMQALNEADGAGEMSDSEKGAHLDVVVRAIQGAQDEAQSACQELQALVHGDEKRSIPSLSQAAGTALSDLYRLKSSGAGQGSPQLNLRQQEHDHISSLLHAVVPGPSQVVFEAAGSHRSRPHMEHTAPAPEPMLGAAWAAQYSPASHDGEFEPASPPYPVSFSPDHAPISPEPPGTPFRPAWRFSPVNYQPTTPTYRPSRSYHPPWGAAWSPPAASPYSTSSQHGRGQLSAQTPEEHTRTPATPQTPGAWSFYGSGEATDAAGGPARGVGDGRNSGGAEGARAWVDGAKVVVHAGAYKGLHGSIVRRAGSSSESTRQWVQLEGRVDCGARRQDSAVLVPDACLWPLPPRKKDHVVVLAVCSRALHTLQCTSSASPGQR